MQEPATAGIDITSFDAVSLSERGAEIELLAEDGATGTGVFVTVLGKNADAVRKYINGVLDKQAREASLAARRGKPVDPKSMEEIRAHNIESAVVRVTGWRNVRQAFDRDLLRQALQRNPHWVDQIVDASADLGNFTSAQPTT